jgi:hypothetical protein
MKLRLSCVAVAIVAVGALSGTAEAVTVTPGMILPDVMFSGSVHIDYDTGTNGNVIAFENPATILVPPTIPAIGSAGAITQYGTGDPGNGSVYPTGAFASVSFVGGFDPILSAAFATFAHENLTMASAEASGTMNAKYSFEL